MKKAAVITCKSYEEYLEGIANLKSRNFIKTVDGMNVEHWETLTFRFMVIKNW